LCSNQKVLVRRCFQARIYSDIVSCHQDMISMSTFSLRPALISDTPIINPPACASKIPSIALVPITSKTTRSRVSTKDSALQVNEIRKSRICALPYTNTTGVVPGAWDTDILVGASGRTIIPPITTFSKTLLLTRSDREPIMALLETDTMRGKATLS
jgi:hypothetical protein